ncbi:MAG: hypothetical protein ACTSYG_10850 [Candidatus Heimdallarchaeota archaeon]
MAGEETGRIVTPTERYTRGGFDIVETEKPYAVTTTPSKFTFKRPSVGVQEVTFKETGAEVLERVGVDLPALDTTPPTREELIAEGGGIFLTGAEAEARGITQTLGEGKPSVHQRAIYTAEDLLGIKKGTSKVVFIPEESANIKPISRMELAESYVSEKVTTPLFNVISESTKKAFGVDVLSREFLITSAPSLIGIGPIGISFGSKRLKEINIIGKQFRGEAGYTALQDIRTKPIRQVVTGAAVSFGASALVGGASALSPTIGTISKVGVGTAGIGLGGYYIYGTGKKVLSSQSLSEAAGVVGVSIKEILFFAAGSRLGIKAFEMGSGWWRTRGRVEIPLERLTQPEVITGKKTFPTAPTRAHFEIFKEGKAGVSLGEPAGAFHTTPLKFWGKAITPETGTSELSGLYGSAYLSPYFSGLKSTGGAYKLFGLGVGGKPGVAYLEPLGFRISRFSWKNVPQFTGQKAIGGKYAWWQIPPKEGVADIPLMKTELEAVFRPGTGVYEFQSGKYYTTIEGVRVPIDVFKYGKEGGRITTQTGEVSLRGGAGSYSLPTSTGSFISATQFIGAGAGKISSKSYTSTSYSKIVSPTSYSKIQSSVKSSLIKSSAKKSIPKSSYKSYTPSIMSSYASAKRSYQSLVSSSKFSYRGFGSSYLRLSRRITPPPSPPPSYKRYGRPKPSPRPRGLYDVFVRRFGKFKPIGKGLSLKQAGVLGREVVGGTLGATYKIIGKIPKGLKVPKGFYKKITPTGVEIIEKPKYRLSRATEKEEIQMFKLLKGGRKKKKKNEFKRTNSQKKKRKKRISGI